MLPNSKLKSNRNLAFFTRDCRYYRNYKAEKLFLLVSVQASQSLLLPLRPFLIHLKPQNHCLFVFLQSAFEVLDSVAVAAVAFCKVKVVGTEHRLTI